MRAGSVRRPLRLGGVGVHSCVTPLSSVGAGNIVKRTQIGTHCSTCRPKAPERNPDECVDNDIEWAMGRGRTPTVKAARKARLTSHMRGLQCPQIRCVRYFRLRSRATLLDQERDNDLPVRVNNNFPRQRPAASRVTTDGPDDCRAGGARSLKARRAAKETVEAA